MKTCILNFVTFPNFSSKGYIVLMPKGYIVTGRTPHFLKIKQNYNPNPLFKVGEIQLWLIKTTWKNTMYYIIDKCNIGALTTQRKEWIWGLSGIWNSTERASYLVFPNGSLITISLKNTSAWYWKCFVTKTELLFNKIHLYW